MSTLALRIFHFYSYVKFRECKMFPLLLTVLCVLCFYEVSAWAFGTLILP